MFVLLPIVCIRKKNTARKEKCLDRAKKRPTKSTIKMWNNDRKNNTKNITNRKINMETVCFCACMCVCHYGKENRMNKKPKKIKHRRHSPKRYWGKRKNIIKRNIYKLKILKYVYFVAVAIYYIIERRKKNVRNKKARRKNSPFRRNWQKRDNK